MTTTERPVLVVGAERSGTTLLRLMLDHHPEISCPHQLEFVVDLLGDDGSPPELGEYRAYLEESAIFQRSRFEVDPGLDYRELVTSFLTQRRGDARIVGGSVHRHLERLLRLWPDARLIHVVRDPRAVARSCVRMGWAGHAWAGVADWIEIERSWDRCRELLPEGQHLEVRYETLVAQPEDELKRICAFLGVGYSADMLGYPNDSTYSAPDSAWSNAWRSQLSEREQRLVDARLGDLLAQRGYPPCGHDPIRVGPLLLRWLRLLDRVGRARFRLRRYGWRLSAQAYLVHRVGGGRWRRSVLARIREVDARYIQ